MYRVFLGAPTAADLKTDPGSYSWRTVHPKQQREQEQVLEPEAAPKKVASPLKAATSSYKSFRSLRPTQSFAFPPRATLEAASRRISLIYQDIVFDDPVEDESLGVDDGGHGEGDGQEATGQGVSIFGGAEQTTLISWPPTTAPGGVSVFRDVAEQTTNISWPRTGRGADDSSQADDDSFIGPSFLINDSSRILLESSQQPPPPTVADSLFFLETQNNPESQSFENSRYSDASSIGRFPSFHFNLHAITSLTRLASSGFTGSQKINALLAVLEVEGPETIRIKKGADAGNQVSVFKMIVSDEEGTVGKLTAWREVADEWGGNLGGVGVKRGDIVHIENVTATCDPKAAMTLTASPYLKSQLVICYRTMPYAHEDGRFRPDLRLGISEPSVRKVAGMVAWFEEMAGLAAP
ncbi:hypothetical protein CPC08DRAFT_759879 [Agrocybe pediades]|nr:hypothetical protein CPC08DRAFT_759879 [Agrocybe pediades]